MHISATLFLGSASFTWPSPDQWPSPDHHLTTTWPSPYYHLTITLLPPDHHLTTTWPSPYHHHIGNFILGAHICYTLLGLRLLHLTIFATIFQCPCPCCPPAKVIFWQCCWPVKHINCQIYGQLLEVRPGKKYWAFFGQILLLRPRKIPRKSQIVIWAGAIRWQNSNSTGVKTAADDEH